MLGSANRRREREHKRNSKRKLQANWNQKKKIDIKYIYRWIEKSTAFPATPLIFSLFADLKSLGRLIYFVSRSLRFVTLRLGWAVIAGGLYVNVGVKTLNKFAVCSCIVGICCRDTYGCVSSGLGSAPEVIAGHLKDQGDDGDQGKGYVFLFQSAILFLQSLSFILPFLSFHQK